MESFNTVLESMNSLLPTRVDKWEPTFARISVSDGKETWSIQFERHTDQWERKVVEVEFSNRGLAKPTGRSSTSSALSLYSTIISLIVKYVHEFKVDYIMFSAAHEDMIPVYKRIATILAHRTGGQWHKDQKDFIVDINI